MTRTAHKRESTTMTTEAQQQRPEIIHSGGPGEHLPPPSPPAERNADHTYDDSTHNQDDENEGVA